jgi:hypothetical protein
MSASTCVRRVLTPGHVPSPIPVHVLVPVVLIPVPVPVPIRSFRSSALLVWVRFGFHWFHWFRRHDHCSVIAMFSFSPGVIWLIRGFRRPYTSSSRSRYSLVPLSASHLCITIQHSSMPSQPRVVSASEVPPIDRSIVLKPPLSARQLVCNESRSQT